MMMFEACDKSTIQVLIDYFLEILAVTSVCNDREMCGDFSETLIIA